MINWENILISIAPYIITGAIIPLIIKGWSWIGAKIANIKNNTIRSALEWATNEAQSTAQTIVNALNQTTVAQLKADAKNGKLTEAQIADLETKSWATFKTIISQKALNILQEHKGDVFTYITNLIQEYVGYAKQGSSVTASNIISVPAVIDSTVPAPSVDAVVDAAVDVPIGIE